MFEPQIRPTRLARNLLFVSARAERKECLCVKLFDFFVGEYSSVWPEICRVFPRFSRDSWVEFQDKTIPGEFFSNFVQTKSILYRNLWNYGLIYAISFRVRIALKKFTQALSYVICTQARRHVHKRVRKGRYGEEKPERFVFGKSVFSLSVCDLLRLTPWVFWYEIFTRHSSLCLLSFGWGLSPKFVPQDWQ